MKDQEEKVTIVAGRSGIIVEAKSGKKHRAEWRLAGLGIYVAVVICIIIAALLIFATRERKAEQDAATQKQLVQAQTDVDALGDINKLGADSDKLIKGSENGTYKVSNKQLAQAYANRGDAHFNDGKYKEAVADYADAVKLDSNQQNLIGHNEFVARYKLGERESLITLLQTLQKPYKDNYEIGMQEHYEEYQSYIDDLKAGKELSL